MRIRAASRHRFLFFCVVKGSAAQVQVVHVHVLLQSSNSFSVALYILHGRSTTVFTKQIYFLYCCCCCDGVRMSWETPPNPLRQHCRPDGLRLGLHNHDLLRVT